MVGKPWSAKGSATTLESAALQREQMLRDEAETLLEVSLGLTSELDLNKLVQRVTDAGTEVTGAQFGAFFYNTVDEKGESYVLYTLSGAPREAFERFGLPRNTPLFGPTFRGEAVVRIADVHEDRRYGLNPPHHGMPQGHLPVRSYLAAPVISRSGEVLGGLFFGHPEPAVFTERSERLVSGLAAQAAVSIDNARLYSAARLELEKRNRVEAELAAMRDDLALQVQALKQVEDELRQADQRKDEFLATLAHELRNPLAPIVNALQMLKLAKDPATGEQARAMMERQVKQMVRLIDDLLDVSRISRGKLALRQERHDLAAILRSAVEISRPLIEQAGHRLSLELPPEPWLVMADETRLAQVFSNLLNNAAKYTEPGGHLRLAVEADGDRIVVKVQDDGIGIPEPLLGRVFDLFMQVDRSLERTHGGLGIGLTLVKRLVELHGGEIEARSEGQGRGSEFIVRLPR